MQLTRRELVGLAAAVAAPAIAEKMQQQYFVYVGAYTNRGASKGIYAWRFDAGKGSLTPIGLAAEIESPSFLTIHPNSQRLYAVSEVNSGGSVTGYSIDRRTGSLTKINSAPSGGTMACHLAVDKTGRCLVVANYGSGSTGILALDAAGRLADKPRVVQHSGSSVNRQRQSGPHAHAVVLSPDNRFVLTPDLGLDQIKVYRLDPAQATLTPNDPPFAKVPAGGGPRHLAFHPSGRFAYVINEMGSAVTAFQYDAQRGALTEIQSLSSVPKDFRGEDNAAEIEVDAAGRHVYASNRGHDSIAVFTIGKDGKLALVENVATQGKVPRNFKLDPTGRFLFAANQNSNNIVLFRVDAKTGRLTPAGPTLEAGAPVCVQFVAAG